MPLNLAQEQGIAVFDRDLSQFFIKDGAEIAGGIACFWPSGDLAKLVLKSVTAFNGAPYIEGTASRSFVQPASQGGLARNSSSVSSELNEC